MHDPKGKPAIRFRWERHTEPGKIESTGTGEMGDDGPVPPLPPAPQHVNSVVPADVREAWKVYDTVMILAMGDRAVADQEFERVRSRKTRRAQHEHNDDAASGTGSQGEGSGEEDEPSPVPRAP